SCADRSLRQRAEPERKPALTWREKQQGPFVSTRGGRVIPKWQVRFATVILSRANRCELALQLQFLSGSESMGDHDSGFDDWWSVGRRCADAVGFFVTRGQATDWSAVHPEAGRDLGGCGFRWTLLQPTPPTAFLYGGGRPSSTA